MTTITASPKKRIFAFSPTKPLTSYFVVSLLGTFFDAYSSWQIISVNQIAIEGNPILSGIASVFGFGGAMIIRAILGMALLLALWFLANQKRYVGARRYARAGLRVVAVVFTLLAFYHIIGTMYFSS